MTPPAHTRTRPSARRRLILAAVVLCAVSLGAAVHQSAAGAGAGALGPGDPGTDAGSPGPATMNAATADGAVTEADGLLPGGVTASDGAFAGIARHCGRRRSTPRGRAS
jgi:hypothetical protein